MIAKIICSGCGSRNSATKMEKILNILPILLAYCLNTLFSECVASDSSYFLFQPPYGGGKPQEAIAEKRSDIESGVGSSLNSITPAETLWVGSHKINWSPLPLLLKFTNPNLYQQQKPQEQPQAQARKYEPFGTSPTKEPYQFQKPTPPYNQPQLQQPHIGNKFTFPSLSNLFAPRPQPPKPPQPQLYQFFPHSSQPKIEPRISHQPGVGYASPPVVSSRGEPSTQSPIFVSTSASILVSPPGTVRALSSPGPSIRPIVEKLKKMTQWSQKKQKKLSKKESNIIVGTPNRDSPLERRIRLKKRLNAPAKSHKHNIEAIILANDNEESDSNEQKIVLKQKRSKVRSGKTSMSRESIEDRGFPSNSNLVIIHPTNAAYMEEEPIVQHSSPKKYELKRKDKKMALFKQDSIKRPAPVTFRFGPEDARPSPYS